MKAAKTHDDLKNNFYGRRSFKIISLEDITFWLNEVITSQMIFEPKIFYKTYLDDYHKFKVILLNKVLEDVPKYEVEMFGQRLEKEDREAFIRTIKCDLRQTYFHSIESFFEIFFALLDRDKPNFDDLNILFTLTNSNWKVNYDKIVKISTGEMSLDFLSEEINYHDHVITIGHYLFYYGLFDNSKFSSEFFKKVADSIEAIKHGMKIIAKDFTDREEYNSYKHGLRIIPSVSELMLADPKTMEVKIRWNLEDSMSFYSKTKDPNELKIKTKLFDTNRDYAMTYFCSNMISNIIFTRQMSIYKDEKVKDNKQYAVGFFGKKEIDDCNKINVEIQDLVYTIKRINTNNNAQ